ncbi:DNAJC21, partial [Symbiodinium sp. KB8]
MHPDKAHQNGMCPEEATKRFQQIQEAYSVLSDAQERAWYDAHREQILRGDDGPGEDPFKTKINLYKYFSVSCFDGFGNDSRGFFAVYSELFEAIDAEEEQWEDADEDHLAMPPFGRSDSEWADVSAFYRHWLDFCSRKAFGHADQWNPKDASNRQVRRAMEQENKKARQAAKKEFNAEVRQLVKFVQKRDPRYQAHQKQQMKENIEKSQRDRAEKDRRKADEAKEKEERKAAARQAEEERWAEARARKEEQRARGEVVSEDEEEGSEEELVEYYCEICKKSFKSEKAFEQHLKSKKHLQAVAKLQKELDREMKEEARASKKQPQNEEESEEEESEQEAEGELQETVSAEAEPSKSSKPVKHETADSETREDDSNSESRSDSEDDFLARFAAKKQGGRGGYPQAATTTDQESDSEDEEQEDIRGRRKKIQSKSDPQLRCRKIAGAASVDWYQHATVEQCSSTVAQETCQMNCLAAAFSFLTGAQCQPCRVREVCVAMPIADIDYREYFTSEKIADLKESFDSFDSSGDGRIGADELYGMFKKLGTNLTRSQIREVMREVDADGSGEIEFEELCILEIKMARTRPRPDLIDYQDYLDCKTIQKLEEAFDRLDADSRGYVSVFEMKGLLEAQGCKSSEDEIDEILGELNSQGELDFASFASAWAIANQCRKRINYREFLDKDEVEELKELFEEGTMGQGNLAITELDHIFRKFGYPMKTKQLRGLLKDFDSDSSGEIDFEEFCVMMLRLKCAKQVRHISPETHDCRSLWLDEGFTAKELQKSGYGIFHMKAAGISVRQILAEAEVTALEMRLCGFTAQELRKAGMGASELRAAGFSLAELRLAGFSHAVLQTANKTLRSYLSKGNLTVLPQQNPKFDPKRKKHTPFMKLWLTPKTSDVQQSSEDMRPLPEILAGWKQAKKEGGMDICEGLHPDHPILSAMQKKTPWDGPIPEDFSSRSAMFKHIKATGHAMLKAAVAEEPTKGKKKKRFAEVLCDAATISVRKRSTLLCCWEVQQAGAAAQDFGRAGRAVAWLADVGSFCNLPDRLEKATRSSTEPAAFRWIDIFKLTCSNAALANVWLPENDPKPVATPEDAAGHEAMAMGAAGAVAKAAGSEFFMAGVASFSPGLRFHPARPREDGDMERMQPLVMRARWQVPSTSPGRSLEFRASELRACFAMARQSDCRVHSIRHAATLPESDVALRLLERVQRNAEAVLRARGWRVLELVELCCCKVAPEQKPGSVAGWCIPAGDAKTATRIALRLRAPKGQGHRIMPFEEVFGTMLHELTHIIHLKHTAAFYELMDELSKQWEQLQATGHILDESGFPTVGGHRVDPMKHNPSIGLSTKLQAKAAEQRLKVNQLMGSGKLGGQRDWKQLPMREKAARAAERRAAEAKLGFGPEELPDEGDISSAPERARLAAEPARPAVRLAPKRRWCQRVGCSCPAPHPDLPVKPELEDKLLQEAILASLAESQSLQSQSPSVGCIVLSDDEGDAEFNVRSELGQVPRERVALGTFWHLACQPPKRHGPSPRHPYASLLPFLTGVPADASPVQSPETTRLTHWRPMSTGNSGRGEALQVVLDGLEFALRLLGAGDLEDPRRSPAMDLKTSINSLEESLKDREGYAHSCAKRFHLFGPGFTADAFRVAEEMAGQPLPADLLSPPDLAEVGPHDVQNPADLVQLLGRACSSCLKLLNQQRLLTSAHHLCFSLAARVLLSLPMDASWYKRPDFNWTLETQNFILERLHLLIRQLAMAALALGPAGDAGPRAVAAMAAAVAFDAVARQSTENVASVLSQALGQGLCLGPGSFVSESSEQAISWPRAAKARSEILEYFEAASIAGQQPVFQGVEVGQAELQLLNGCSLLLGLGPVRSTAVQLLSGEDPSLMAQLPQLGMMRDVGFLAQLLSRSGALPLTTPKSGNQNVLGN